MIALTASVTAWAAGRAREDGLYLDAHRAQIAESIRIGDAKLRDRALAMIAIYIRGRAWCAPLAAAALLAWTLEEHARYGALDDVRLAVRGTTTKGA